MYDSALNKIVSSQEISEALDNQFRKSHRIVFTNGCFDILHKGHIYYLSKAKENGDILIVGINSDASVTRLKGAGRPVKDQESRTVIIAALQCVDFVVVFEEDTPIELIKMIQPDVLVKGGDYRAEDIVGYDEVIAGGGSVVTIPFLEGYSSTDLINRLK